MNTSSDNKLEKPSIIQALLSGFNTVANKPYVMIPPIILDLFLWFGPAWRVDSFFMPLIQSLTKLPGLDSLEYQNVLEEYIALWQEIVTNFNLAVTLRTLPVGIPSLMVSKTPFLNPLGQPLVFNLTTNFEVLGFWVIFMLIGFFFANIYFQYISKQIIELNNGNNFKSIMRTFFQIILMPVLLLIILIILTIPLVFLITLVTLISPTIAQFILLTAGVIVLWIVMPLIFTPHGIFLYKQNLISAMMTSISVVRTSMGNGLSLAGTCGR